VLVEIVLSLVPLFKDDLRILCEKIRSSATLLKQSSHKTVEVFMSCRSYGAVKLNQAVRQVSEPKDVSIDPLLLRKNAGKWVATIGDQLIDADTDLARLKKKVQENISGNIFFMYIPVDKVWSPAASNRSIQQ